MSQLNNNNKSSQPPKDVYLIKIIAFAITILAVAFYKIYRYEERIQSRQAAAANSKPEGREQLMDKYMNEYAGGAAWALKNEVIDPEQCNDAGTSLENLGCTMAATELRDQVEKGLVHELARAEQDSEHASEPLSPEDAMYNEAYLEPETN